MNSFLSLVVDCRFDKSCQRGAFSSLQGFGVSGLLFFFSGGFHNGSERKTMVGYYFKILGTDITAARH